MIRLDLNMPINKNHSLLKLLLGLFSSAGSCRCESESTTAILQRNVNNYHAQFTKKKNAHHIWF